MPDVFHLRTQARDGLPINPGTVRTDAIRLFNAVPVYSLHAVHPTPLLIHAPGQIYRLLARTPLRGSPRSVRVSLRVTPWLSRRYYVLVNGLERMPQVRVNGVPITTAAPHQYLPTGILILQLVDTSWVELSIDAEPRLPLPRP